MPPPHSFAAFFLDECLPAQVGRALAMVGHPILTPDDQQQRGSTDQDLIPWMASNGYVWITKDDRAQREHAAMIRQHQLSVVWIRGLDRRKNTITIKDLHLMLTVKLPEIEVELRVATRTRYYLLYLASGNHPVKKITSLDEMDHGSGRRARRQ